MLNLRHWIADQTPSRNQLSAFAWRHAVVGWCLSQNSVFFKVWNNSREVSEHRLDLSIIVDSFVVNGLV